MHMTILNTDHNTINKSYLIMNVDSKRNLLVAKFSIEILN